MHLPVRVLGFAPMFVCPLSGSTDLLIFSFFICIM